MDNGRGRFGAGDVRVRAHRCTQAGVFAVAVAVAPSRSVLDVRGARASVAVVIATYAPYIPSRARLVRVLGGFGWRVSSRGGLAAAARRASAGTRGLPPPRASLSPRPGPNHIPGGLHPRGSTRIDGRRTTGAGRLITHTISSIAWSFAAPAASQFDLWALLRQANVLAYCVLS